MSSDESSQPIQLLTREQLNAVCACWLPDCLNVFVYPTKFGGFWTPEIVLIRNGQPKLGIKSDWCGPDRTVMFRLAVEMAEAYIRQHHPAAALPLRSEN